jgi:hypothetical protein
MAAGDTSVGSAPIANGQSLQGMPTKWDGPRFDVVLPLPAFLRFSQPNGQTTLLIN